jgi:hypothetical protein
MRDSKSLFLLVFALVLITVSFVLISIWGYHFYFQGKDNKLPPAENSLIAKKTITRDSLQNVLDSTIQQLGAQPDSAFYFTGDSSDKALEAKLLEYQRLKGEITEILKNKTSSKDMAVASEKIGELQQSIDELRNQNNQVAQENARLNKMVQQLLSQNKTKKNISSSGNEKRSTDEELLPALPLLVSHLRFSAMAVNGEYIEPTTQAAEAARLEGSFQINIQSSQNNSPDIYIVITQPNGKVLLNSAWESGTFATASGRKIYSVLLHFENKDNNSRLQFSINSNKFQKGVYAMEIYHNGILIGRLTKKLS